MFKRIVRFLLPYPFRHFIVSCIPKIYKFNTLVLENPQLIIDLVPISDRFIIREITKNDFELLRNFHSHKGYKSFKKNTIPRLNSPDFIGITAIDSESNEMAYLSWIIVNSIAYFEEFGIFMKSGEYLVKDIFVIPKYRHQGLSTRMEQERINYCVRRGNCKKIYTQPFAKNIKGNESYFKIGYKKLQTDYLLRWYVFDIYRSLKGFIKRPFRIVIK